MYFEGRVNLLMLPSFRDYPPELRRLVIDGFSAMLSES